MGLQWTPESEYIKELQKWESVPTEFVRTPQRPYVFVEYPKALYRATAATGGPTISGYIEARDEAHERLLKTQGWSTTQEAAIAAVQAHEDAIAQAAAERAFADRRMTPKAQAEARAADDATPAHVPEVPVTPIRKRQKRAYVRNTPLAVKE